MISKEYLDSFPTVGDMNALVRNGNNDRYFLVDAGKRLRFSSCEQVTEYGLSCDQAITLTSSQLSALELGGSLTNLIVGPAAERYLIQGGALREILNDESLAATGTLLPSASPVRLSALSYLPIGTPIATSGSVVENRTTKGLGIIAEETFFPIDPGTAKDINFGLWFKGSGSSLAGTSIATLTQGPTIQSIVANGQGQQFLLTATGKRLIQDSANWIENPPVLPNSILDAIVTVEGELVAPAVVRSTENTDLFLVAAGQLRPIAKIDRKVVRSTLDDPTIHRIAPSALSQMNKGSQVIPPGALVQISGTNRTFLVDGLSRLYRVPSSAHAKALGLGSTRVVTTKSLSSYDRAGLISGLKVICDSKTYLAVAGKYYLLSEAIAAHYPKTARTLDSGTCATLNLTTTLGSRFIRTPDMKYYLVQDGLKRPLVSRDQYLALRGDSPKFISVDSYFASTLETGTRVKKGATSVSDDTQDVKTYVVKSGDTLSGIAQRFGTTVAALTELNGIKSDAVLRIGQELKLP